MIWQIFNPKSNGKVASSDSVNEKIDAGVSLPRYILTWIQILIVPFLIWAVYILPPFQPPTKGIINNWVFMFFCMPFGSLCITTVYCYWGHVFLGTFYISPGFLSALCIFFLYMMICQFYTFPMIGIGLIVPVVVTLTFTISLYVRTYHIEKRREPEFTKALKNFSKFRMTVGTVFIICCGYVILFNVVDSDANLQRFLIFAFTILIFLIKLFVQDFMRQRVAPEKSSLVTFWFEFFYEFFSTAVFPDISSPVTFAILMVLKVFSLNAHLCLLTDWWADIRRKALSIEKKFSGDNSMTNDFDSGDMSPYSSSTFPSSLPSYSLPSSSSFPSPLFTRTSSASPSHPSLISQSKSISSIPQSKSVSGIPQSRSIKILPAIQEDSDGLVIKIYNNKHNNNLNKLSFEATEDPPINNLMKSRTWDIETPNYEEEITATPMPRKARAYQMLRRVVFSDLDDQQLKHYAVLNSLYSIISHIIVPVYWIPMSYFLKHGYNKQYFVYYFFSDSQFETSLLYSAISFAVSVVILIVTYFIILKWFKIDYFQVSKTYVVKDKWFFVFSIVSATCICWSILSQHHNIAWTFFKRTHKS